MYEQLVVTRFEVVGVHVDAISLQTAGLKVSYAATDNKTLMCSVQYRVLGALNYGVLINYHTPAVQDGPKNETLIHVAFGLGLHNHNAVLAGLSPASTLHEMAPYP